MPEWLLSGYAQLVVNFRILWENLTGCFAVHYLQILTLSLFALLALRLGVHLLVSYRLKRRFFHYCEAQEPELFGLLRSAARDVGLSRLPELFRFDDVKPLAFTLGSLRPVVFVAPRLLRGLADDQLRALLVHELTHIKRRDGLRTWGLEIALALVPAFVVQLFAIHFIISAANSLLAFAGALAGIVLLRLCWPRIERIREETCDDLTVDVTRDPLGLASSLIRVWEIGRVLPRHRFKLGLAFLQPFLRRRSAVERRVGRLVDYRRPWLKFLLGKLARGAAVLTVTALLAVSWTFKDTELRLAFENPADNGRSGRGMATAGTAEPGLAVTSAGVSCALGQHCCVLRR